MVDPPNSAIERLIEVLGRISSREIPPRLPAWRGFVRAWFEACSPKARRASRNREELRQEISDIVEDILPERSLRSGEVSRFLSSPFHSTEYDPASGILYEVGPPDGVRRLARAEILRPRGLWEKLTPLRCAAPGEEAASLTVRYALRWPSARKLVRDALTQELEGQAGFEISEELGREADREGGADYQLRAVSPIAPGQRGGEAAVNPPSSAPPFPEESHAVAGAPMPAPARQPEVPPAPTREAAAAPEVVKRYPRRAAWLAEQLRIRGWTKHDLQRFDGPDRASTQKILDGLPVRDVVLERVAQALSAASPTHSLKDPRVEFGNIPQD
jgi:hypothetical protein